MNKILTNLLIFLLIFWYIKILFIDNPRKIQAQNIEQESKRFVTVVIPVRGREYWQDLSKIKILTDYITMKKIPVTFLIQYQVLQDREAVELLRNLPHNNEIGLLLEVDQDLADELYVKFLIGEGDRMRADKIFLSGYSPLERKRILDRNLAQFRKIFGFFPQAVGAWYIDAFSLNYLKDNFNINSILNVSDQYQTDTYGIWGRWWGVPYYPSKYNPSIPAKSKNESLDAVIIQWAQRDLLRGYGLKVQDSTYSTQANDYLYHHNLSINYFEKLAIDFLFAPNEINQLTIGLEAGQEGFVYFDELTKQIETIKELEDIYNANIQFVTMSQFSFLFKEKNQEKNSDIFLEGADFENRSDHAFWYNTPYYRLGLKRSGDKLYIRDLRLYDNFLSEDTFHRDNNEKLVRIVPSCIDELIKANPITFADRIDQVKVLRLTDGVTVTYSTQDERGGILKLSKDRILLNDKLLVKIERKHEILGMPVRIMHNWLIDYYLQKSADSFGGLRYSIINNKLVFGLWLTKDRLYAVSFPPLTVGVYRYPFQTLVRFKQIPTVDIPQILAQNLVNNKINCTIEL